MPRLALPHVAIMLVLAVSGRASGTAVPCLLVGPLACWSDGRKDDGTGYTGLEVL